MSDDEEESIFGEPIFAYTRKQALEDGTLVDLTQFEVTKEFTGYHMACTAAVWSIIEAAAGRDGQDVEGILHDVFTMARLSAQRQPDAQQVLVTVMIDRRTHVLKLHIGPGDTPEPVLTLMLHNED